MNFIWARSSSGKSWDLDYRTVLKTVIFICGCNPQTLRYYAHVNLLKPVKVDKWSGYRFYEEEQALAFVKVKNLQKAGFTIDEIKGLLDKDNLVIYQAFEEKIAEEEKRLQEIKDIQRSYQTEMNNIREKINEARKRITETMHGYDASEEFGIDSSEYKGIISSVNNFFDNIIVSDTRNFDYEEFHIGEEAAEEKEYFNLLNNPDYEVDYEKHGWDNVKEFLDEFNDIEDKVEYALYFRVNEVKEASTMAFANTLLGILIARNTDKKSNFTCNIEKSEDGKNHFWLLKHRE